MQIKQQQLLIELNVEQPTGSNLKEEQQGCILWPCLFKLYSEYIIEMPGWMNLQTGIKTAGRNTNNFRYADIITLVAESEEELRSLLMSEEEENKKNWLKTQHSKN